MRFCKDLNEIIDHVENIIGGMIESLIELCMSIYVSGIEEEKTRKKLQISH